MHFFIVWQNSLYLHFSHYKLDNNRANNEVVKVPALSLNELLFGSAGVKWADGGTKFHPENIAVIYSIIEHFSLPSRSLFHLYYIRFISRWYLLVQNKAFSVFSAFPASVVLYLKPFKAPD